MSQILPFPDRRPALLRRHRVLRLMAALILLLFSAALIGSALAALGLWPSP
jgi:hypothetical protein